MTNQEFYGNLPTHRRGKHKIFIGMAPGVGKTYRMLEEGHQLKAEGIDVVIGLLETHGRQETLEKSIGLELIARANYAVSGITLNDMNTEAIINRSPQLVLIDELAHTNVPGAPQEKRYQDVELILASGIDVYSTLNIQHIESLNDLVAKITGVVVRERVPDRLLEEADEVLVVDVTPETLEERLKEGKIYASHKIDQALQNFFQRRNLIALRELALREVADNIEEDGLTEQVNHKSDHALYCNIQERILICVSTHPNSLRLVRRGARIASYMNAKFYCLFVSDPDRFLTKKETLHVETCEKLTQEFGGEFLRINETNVVQAIVQIARTYRINQIVLGATHQSRWQLLLKGSLIQKLMQQLIDVDFHVISSNDRLVN